MKNIMLKPSVIKSQSPFPLSNEIAWKIWIPIYLLYPLLSSIVIIASCYQHWAWSIWRDGKVDWKSRFPVEESSTWWICQVRGDQFMQDLASHTERTRWIQLCRWQQSLKEKECQCRPLKTTSNMPKVEVGKIDVLLQWGEGGALNHGQPWSSQ